MSPINLLVADDHTLLRRSLVMYLQTYALNLQIYEAANGVEALEIIEANPIELVLLDIQMPLMNGIDCLKKIKQEYTSTKVIVLSQFENPALLGHLLKLGVDGFLLKDCPPEELVTAITQVLENGQYYNELMKETLRLSLSTKGISTDFVQLAISPREFQVASYINEGKSNIEIAAKLGLSHHTIETYRKTLMKKLKCKNAAELVKLLHTTGMLS